MKIIAHNWKWAYPLSRREGKPEYVNWHHAAAKHLTPAALHRIHLGLGWCGFAYNLYIRKNGRVHRGRPLQFCGGGAIGHWADVGVCLEGNYDVEEEMPEKQLRAAQEVKDWLAERYPGIGHRGHRQVPGNQTACPGKHFPVKAIMAGVPDEVKPIKLTAKHLVIPHTRGVKAGWCNVGFRPWLKRLRREGHGKRIVIKAERITIPVPEKLPPWWDEMLAWRAAKRVVVTKTRKRVPMSWLSRRKP